jgi:NitT/TauT family transport system permease protein
MKKYAARLLVLLLFLVCWQVLAWIIAKPFLPGPEAAFRALWRLAGEGRLGRHTRASLSRILWSILISLPAAALGLAAGRSARLDRIVSPAVYLFHPLPKAAFLPIIMLLFGLGEVSKVALVSFIIFSQILVTMRDTGRRIDPELLEVVRSMGAGRLTRFRHVALPAALPGLCTALRVSLGTALAVLFLAETFASESGLGYLIVDAWTRIAYPEMYAAIVALSILGLLLFAAVDILERLLCPWQRES